MTDEQNSDADQELEVTSDTESLTDSELSAISGGGAGGGHPAIPSTNLSGQHLTIGGRALSPRN